jgi:hypothetical protein
MSSIYSRLEAAPNGVANPVDNYKRAASEHTKSVAVFQNGKIRITKAKPHQPAGRRPRAAAIVSTTALGSISSTRNVTSHLITVSASVPSCAARKRAGPVCAATRRLSASRCERSPSATTRQWRPVPARLLPRLSPRDGTRSRSLPDDVRCRRSGRAWSAPAAE